ncbi:hypothetical protein ACJX0J_035121, partial [Zea mays]
VLLNMLLNSPLPVYSLVSADDEILVRDVLYDSLILVDYSFINNGAGVDLLPVYVSRLIITLDAVNDASWGGKGDQGRAVSRMGMGTCEDDEAVEEMETAGNAFMAAAHTSCIVFFTSMYAFLDVLDRVDYSMNELLYTVITSSMHMDHNSWGLQGTWKH